MWDLASWYCNKCMPRISRNSLNALFVPFSSSRWIRRSMGLSCSVSSVRQMDRLSKEKNSYRPAGALLPVPAEVLLSKAAGEDPRRGPGFYYQAPQGVICLYLFLLGPPEPLSLCTGKGNGVAHDSVLGQPSETLKVE